MDGMLARVLLAEDPAGQRAQYGGLLRAAGMTVHEAPEGQMALDLCRIVRPDVLVLDSDLPGLDGRELLTRVRGDRKIGTTAVVVVTDDDPATLGSAALEDEGTSFLSKEARPADLLNRVLRALKQKARLDETTADGEARSPQSGIDALTGLPNRRATADALQEAARRARESREPMAIALIGVDDLPSISHRHGYRAADDVLCALAGRLGDHIETVGRWSGSEFVAVLPNSPPALAIEAAERLRQASASHAISLGADQRVPVTVSVGWACSDFASPDRLLRQADLALSEARERGRNSVSPQLPTFRT